MNIFPDRNGMVYGNKRTRLKLKKNSHLKSLDTKVPRHIPMEIPGPGLEQAHRCGGVSPFNVTLPLII
jgi:hypothetical protein